MHQTHQKLPTTTFCLPNKRSVGPVTENLSDLVNQIKHSDRSDRLKKVLKGVELKKTNFRDVKKLGTLGPEILHSISRKTRDDH